MTLRAGQAWETLLPQEAVAFVAPLSARVDDDQDIIGIWNDPPGAAKAVWARGIRPRGAMPELFLKPVADLRSWSPDRSTDPGLGVASGDPATSWSNGVSLPRLDLADGAAAESTAAWLRTDPVYACAVLRPRLLADPGGPVRKLPPSLTALEPLRKVPVAMPARSKVGTTAAMA
jgi:hypothetical protein